MLFTKLLTSVRVLKRRKYYVGFRLYSDGADKKCEINTSGADGQNSGGGGSKKAAVLGVYENNKKFELTPAAQEIDHKSGGKISQQLNGACPLKLGQAIIMTDIGEYGTVALASYGPKDAGYDDLEALDVAKENVRWGVGAGVVALAARCGGAVCVDPAAHPAAAAEAATLAAWRFQEFKTADRVPPTAVSPLKADGEWEKGAIRGAAQNWARYLADMPANLMTPVDLAQAAIDVLCPLGVKIEARDREWIELQNMQAFLTVARGSCSEPMFLECSWSRGQDGQPPLLFAAKGVTFDSGGLCLKQCENMRENRGSMAGAAVVLAALNIIAKLKLPINVRAVIPICENMVSGQCMKVGDIVRALNGLSIQIENTDMEGRLMMADALVYGQSQYKPALVVDVATFTKGSRLATGGGAYACFATSERAWGAVRAAGAASGDRAWRLPLWNYYLRQITNEPAVDLRNQGSGHASACIGAAFLKHFVCCEWVHLDIAGVGKLAHGDAPPYLHPQRMTGRPTRALAALTEQLAAAASAHHKGDKGERADSGSQKSEKKCCGGR